MKISIRSREYLQEIEEELLTIVEAENKSKITIIPKSDIRTILGRSPDISDTLIMRAYFEVREGMVADSAGVKDDNGIERLYNTSIDNAFSTKVNNL